MYDPAKGLDYYLAQKVERPNGDEQLDENLIEEGEEYSGEEE